MNSGAIAKVFAKDLIENTSDFNQLTGVLSRSKQRASDFLSLNKLPLHGAHTEFESLANSVDVCYIATPHTTHVDMAMQCLQHGISVLVEKPFALNTEGLNRVLEVIIL